jgi:antitoxin component YwqK of YwqJK toxin-antitoxin module
MGWPYGNDVQLFDRFSRLEYRGNLVDGKMQGLGKLYHSSGVLKFEGEFRNNGVHGKNITIR